jgi:predicted small lipoprotein YifL
LQVKTPAWFLLIVLSFSLAACGSRGTPTEGPDEFFRPPEAANAPTPFSTKPIDANLSEANPTQALPATPAPVCIDGLRYQEDLSIPDGTQVSAGQTLDKRWQVENTGSCNWDERYRVQLIAGSEMGAAPQQALYPARSGTQAVIRMLFTAPNEPGAYRSAWQAYTPQGNPFGDPFFIEVIVR